MKPKQKSLYFSLEKIECTLFQLNYIIFFTKFDMIQNAQGNILVILHQYLK